jgi:hypothetical protein
MDETRYRVVLNGTLTGEFDEATTRRNLGRLFRLNQEKVRVLMSGRERVIKSDLDEETAMSYLIRLAEAGCESYVQEVGDHDAPDFDEKRSNDERRMRFRRGPRAGAILPDRRLQIRRTIDLKLFRQTGRLGYALSLGFQTYPKDL